MTKERNVSGAAGVSAGTTLVGLFSQLPEGAIKGILLLLSPTITIVVSFFWDSLWEEIRARVADYRINRLIKQQKELVEQVKVDKAASEEEKFDELNALQVLKRLQSEIRRDRVKAIVKREGDDQDMLGVT